ncbi:DUF397 domain-containing protein [Actinomadura latina]|uniref:DUF397 domain-containing protein n=1 Tax=Actinomadura latina TaxID=163603 RepID=A0A846Z403_9ACTN|nr:DUF397 domain-containing protein [Actinomadura latina]NKZ04996.1 DUF397 domain-containing protein [Actinomadura latina]
MPLENLTCRRASRSLSNGGECVELASIPDGPVLLIPRSALRTALTRAT